MTLLAVGLGLLIGLVVGALGGGACTDAYPSALSFATRISENFPLKRPTPGFGMVSAAPSASPVAS